MAKIATDTLPLIDIVNAGRAVTHPSTGFSTCGSGVRGIEIRGGLGNASERVDQAGVRQDSLSKALQCGQSERHSRLSPPHAAQT